MASDVLLVKELNRLGAADPISAETLADIKQGEVLTATIRRARNPRHHRMFFALLNTVFESQNKYATLDHLLDAFKVATGHYDLMMVDGRECLRLRSISFAKMDQTAFKQFFDKALDFIVTKVLPRASKTDLERRVMEIIGGNA